MNVVLPQSPNTVTIRVEAQTHAVSLTSLTALPIGHHAPHPNISQCPTKAMLGRPAHLLSVA